MGLRIFGLYGSVCIFAYLPQLLNYVEPFKTWIGDAPAVSVFVLPLASVIAAIITAIGVVSLLIVTRAMSRPPDRRAVFLWLIVIGVAVAACLIMGIFTAWQMELIFSPQLIPVVISSFIGMVGAYVVTCFTHPNCRGRLAAVQKDYTQALRDIEL
jgi:hypothetical protein